MRGAAAERYRARTAHRAPALGPFRPSSSSDCSRYWRWRFSGHHRHHKKGRLSGGLDWLPQLTSNHFRLMGLKAFPSETVSIVLASKPIDHALACWTNRLEHHFFVACRTTRENRWDTTGRYTCCRHVCTSVIQSATTYHNGRTRNKFGPNVQLASMKEAAN